MTRAYLSSTYSDLREFREAVRIALTRQSVDLLAMEGYVAGDERPLDKCLADVAKCDLYIGLFAWRYGFVPPGHDKSITELEYREAVRLGIPCLIFLLAEDASWPRPLMPTAVPPPAYRPGMKEPSSRSTRARVSTLNPPWVWKSAPRT